MYGYCGRLLHVNLTRDRIATLNLDLSLVRPFLGGAGLGCRILYNMIGPDTDPLGPENPLLLLTGPFTGTAVPAGSRAVFCARSPQTGLLGYSVFGGHLGADLKFAGYDGVIITGRASRPSYIFIDDSTVEVRDATSLWGKDTATVWDILKEETGLRRAGVARIGPAGERLIKYANVMVDHHRAAGRTGMGAVMGSKQLKAIVVHGSHRSVDVANADALLEYAQRLNEDKAETPPYQLYSEVGSAGFTETALELWGSMPVAYYTEGEFDGGSISGTTVRDTILVGRTSCYRCPIACGRVIEVKEGKYATGRFAGPEYEVTGTMGTLIKNSNLEALAFINRQMDLYGIDTITAGNTIAFAYYLYNTGRASADDLDGITPEWGDPGPAIEFIDRIVRREGIGAVMAEGSLALGERFGVPELAAQVHGLELAQHDPRAFSGMTIAYATGPRGACHMSADMYPVQMGLEDEEWGLVSTDRFGNEADVAARLQDLRCVTNSLLMCHFYPILSVELVDMLRLVTGWDYTLDEIRETGERIFTLMRLLNLRLGYNPRDEGLPKIVLQPLEGPTEGYVPDVEEQLNTWYRYRGWDRASGQPSEKRVRELGLTPAELDQPVVRLEE